MSKTYNLTYQQKLKFPCFHCGWNENEDTEVCLNIEICKLFDLIDKVYLPEPLRLHISCEKANFPPKPRKKRETKKVE